MNGTGRSVNECSGQSRQAAWLGMSLLALAGALPPGPVGAACATPSVLWTRTSNGPSNSTDLVARAATDTAGNVIVAGHETSGNLNWLTRKYDSAGNLLWQQGFAGAAGGIDEVYDVDTDASDNVIVGGTESVAGQGYNWRIRAYDPNGTPLWNWTYNSPANGDDRLYGVAVDPSGNVFAVGFETRSDLGQGQNLLVVKLDALGAFQWQRTYTSAGLNNDFAWDADTDSTGNLIVGVNEIVGGQQDWLILRYSPTGVTTWIGTYSGVPGTDEAWGVAVDGLDGFAVSGLTPGPGGIFDAIVRKYDSAGTLQWTRTYHSPGNADAAAFGCAADGAGNILLGGFESRPDVSQAMNWLAIKYDPAGNVCWTWTENASDPLGSNDFIRGVAFDPSGNAVLAGSRAVSGQGDNWLVRKLGAAPAADRYRIESPAAVYAGVPFWLTVVAIDGTAATKTDYCGTSSFTSTDPGAKIEGTNMDAYNFTWSSSLACFAAPNENGVRQFVNVVFQTPCTQILTVVDTLSPATFMGTATILVQSARLEAGLSVSTTAPTEGVPFTVTLTVTNTGIGTVAAGGGWLAGAGVVVSGPTPSGPVVIPGGGVQGFTWNVTAGSAGGLCLTASASGIECGVLPVATATTWCGTVAAAVPGPAITAVKQLLTPAPARGGQVIYRLIVTNTGAVTSSSVGIFDSLPVGLIGITTSAPALMGAPLTYLASTGATTYIWYAVTTFVPGQVLTITITGTVDPSTTLTSICNRFDATMSWMGWVQASNVVCFAVPAVPPPPPPPDDGLTDGVKIVGGVRGYLEPKKGEMANILVRPTGAGTITIRIYNLKGDLVRTLTGSSGGGRTEVLHWDTTDDAGRPVPSGVYPILIEAPGIRYMDKLAVLR